MAIDVATVTRQEAQRLLGASDRTLRRLIQLGKIGVVRGVGQDQILVRDDVMRVARQANATISQEEAAARIGVTPRTVRRRLGKGTLDGVPTPGGRRRILVASIDAALDPAEPGALDSMGHPTLDSMGQAPVGQTQDIVDNMGQTGQVSHVVQTEDEDAEYVPLLSRPMPSPAAAVRSVRTGRRRTRGVLTISAVLATLVAVAYAARELRAAPTSAHRPVVVAQTDAAPATPTVVRPTILPARHDAPVAVHVQPKPKSRPKHHPAAQTGHPPAQTGHPAVPTRSRPVAAPAAAGSVCHDLYGSEGIC